MDKETAAAGERKRPASKRVRKRRNGKLKKIRLKIRIRKKYAVGFFALAALLILIIVIARGCGVNHKTPEKVTTALIKSYVDGNYRKVRKCYGIKTADENLQSEMDATMAYLEAHKPQGVQIDDCNSIYQDGVYTYVYIIYELQLEDGQGYPCIGTYMIQNKEDKYYVLTTSDITDEMSSQAAEAYTDFMNTKPYQDYLTAYDKFIKKNPGYEEKITSKLNK